MDPFLVPIPEKGSFKVHCIVGFSTCLEVINQTLVPVPRSSQGISLTTKIPCRRREYVGGTSYDIAVALNKTFGLAPLLIYSVAQNPDEPARQFMEKHIASMDIPCHPLPVRHASSVGDIVIELGRPPFILSSKPGYVRLPIAEIQQQVVENQPGLVVATGVIPEEVELVEALFMARPEIPRILNPRLELIRERAPFSRVCRLNPLVILNHEELGILLDTQLAEHEVTPEHVSHLHDLGPETIIVTCNEFGSVLSIPSKQIWIHQQARQFDDPVDKTGAGDAFLSAVIAAMFQGKTPVEAMHWGATFAGLKVLREGGANVPSANEFASALQQ